MFRMHALTCSLVVLVGCAGSGETISDLSDISVTALMDLNATSPRFGEAVHPDDYASEISAWYFGHAT